MPFEDSYDPRPYAYELHAYDPHAYDPHVSDSFQGSLPKFVDSVMVSPEKRYSENQSPVSCGKSTPPLNGK